jgi:hypothetical protein
MSRLAFTLVFSLLLPACVSYYVPDDDDSAEDVGDDDTAPAGIEVEPAEVLDFGTVEECTEHSGTIGITNHGPGLVTVTVDVDELLVAGFIVEAPPELTIEEGKTISFDVGFFPGPSSVGSYAGAVHLTTAAQWVQVTVTGEVVAGDSC